MILCELTIFMRKEGKDIMPRRKKVKEEEIIEEVKEEIVEITEPEVEEIKEEVIEEPVEEVVEEPVKEVIPEVKEVKKGKFSSLAQFLY